MEEQVIGLIQAINILDILNFWQKGMVILNVKIKKQICTLEIPAILDQGKDFLSLVKLV